MNECAVCYVSDTGFLLPTIISILSLRKFVPSDKADVYLYIIDESDGCIQNLMQFLKPFSVQIIPMHSSSFSGFDESKWNNTHCTKSTLGRFLISDSLSKSNKRILYLDGDTLITGNPLALINYSVPEGKFAAVEDADYFCSGDWTKFGSSIRKHFADIGITKTDGYFNAGVFLVSVGTWSLLAKEAFEYFKNNVNKCRYHDQSALNGIIGSRRVRLSFEWNFQTAYRNWNMEKYIKPKIYHFTEIAKPWMGPLDPWGDMFPIYENEIKKVSHLNLPRKLFSSERISTENSNASKRRAKLRYLFPYRLYFRQKMLKQLNAQAIPV